MITRRKLVIAFGAGALAPLASFAQQPGRIYRIGFLSQVSLGASASRVDALREGLRELGYIEGKNIALEVRAPEKFDQLPV